MENPGKETDNDADISVIDHYKVNAHGTIADVSIYMSKHDFTPIYKVTFTGISNATKLLLLSFRSNLISLVPLDLNRINDEVYI